MEWKQKVTEFVEELQEQYFIRRDMASLRESLSQQISWIGTGADELRWSMEEVRQALVQDVTEYGGVFSIKDSRLETRLLAEGLYLVWGTICAVPEDPTLAEECLRVTMVLSAAEDGLRMEHVHFSHADPEQQQGHCFVPRSIRAEKRELQLMLEANARQSEYMAKHIPGGAHQCCNDEHFTLLTMSDSFLKMLGYTREEIKERFDDRFFQMICPEDREQVRRNTQLQLQNGPDLDLEYRVMHRDGRLIWVLDKGRLMGDGDEERCFFCLLIEITERKLAQEELRLSLEQHRVIMDQTTDIIFQWDIRQDILTFSSNWRKRFGYAPITSKISDRIPLSENIHPDDMPAFVTIMKNTAAGVPYSETEFRIRNSTGRYFWCRIRATTQYDADRRPIQAVGVIVDIDEEKRQKQALLEQAQRDALTGLYNKAAINSLVEQRMRGAMPHCRQMLMIIDVDNFKGVNDTYGHLCGDSLLSDVAAALKGSIRSSDLAGRIGGDEFLVYLPEVMDEQAARSKADGILMALGALRPAEDAPPIRCSIGVALFDWGEEDYLNVYQKADRALYYQKNNGRGGCTFYTAEMAEEPDNRPGSAIGVDIVSENNNVDDEFLAQYVFRTLYAARDTIGALDRLLEIVGRSYDVSRAYIFESSPDGQRTSITFEWCREDILPQKDTLQDLSYREDLGDYLRNFDENGVFYCPDITQTDPTLHAILAPQGICSMLQCAIVSNGEFWGGIGFDECRQNRNWSAQQVAAFKLTAHVMASFLVQQRLRQRLGELTGRKGLLLEKTRQQHP